MADRDAKGRGNTAKLTAAEVLEIRQLISEGAKLVDLACWFEVTRKTISDIKRRRTWQRLPE